MLTYAPDHWVVVSLHSGGVYAGKLSNADTSVAIGDRDLVLEEPALYDEASGRYLATPYQHLFLPAAAVYSIAAVYEPKLDLRVTEIGEPIFQEARDERQENTTVSIASTSDTLSAGMGRARGEQAVDADTPPVDPAAASTSEAEEVGGHDT